MPQPRPSTVRPSTPLTTPPLGSWLAAAAALAIAASASAMLCLHHFGALALPGCGAGSPCDQAARTAFGAVPGLGWPVSFVGAAYFSGLLVAWLSGRGRWSRGLWIVTWLGVAGSVVFSIAAVALKVPCVYCFVAHGANLVFALILHFSVRRSGVHRGWQSVVATVVGLSTLGVLVVADDAATAKAKAKAERGLAESIAEIARGGEQAVEAAAVLPAPAGQALAQEPDATEVVVPPAGTDAALPVGQPLTGRYRWGPEAASVRIVMFTGYQCPDCKTVEAELETLMRDPSLSVSFSARHFPLSTDCNPNAPGNRHGNACWAARAAETAGQLGGADAFVNMHMWLFARGGSFTDADIRAQAATLGLDPQAFSDRMQSAASLQPVTEDVARAMALGIFQTPFIFINGVELRGWNAPQALTRAVRAAAASAPATAVQDLPASAAEKLIEDWRQMPRVSMPSSLRGASMGPADATVEVVMWGDYQERFTAEADGLLRLFTKGSKPNIRYTFMQFPVDKTCNPVTQVTAQPLACRAAKAAKAAETLAGPDGFWLMHERLMMNQNGMTDAVLEGVALELGLQPADLFEAMEQPFIAEAIVADAREAQKLGVRSIPMLFIGGRLVGRWKAENENILPRIIEAAAAGQ